ncbi:MAG TPA: SBBP repeat-containing protein [Anaerolineales bacterium]
MRKRSRLIKAVTALILLLLLATLGLVPVLADTQVETVATFDPLAGELPEGIAVDKVGTIYFSFDPLGEVWKISPGEPPSLFKAFGDAGALGMAVDALGNVYVARETFNPDTHGVWRIDRDGVAERLAGSENIVYPNSLAFDKRGNIYVTDTILGAVWRIPPNGATELWLQHDLLEGLNLPEIPIPFPLGANGIAFRQGNLYVANTEKAHVVRIPVLGDGSAGEPQIVAEGPALFPLDGIALDVHGNLYALAIAQSTLLRIDPADGSMTTLATADDGLDFPASLAFGTGRSNRQSVFVTNFAIGPPGGAGPGILKIDVGMPGMPLP